MKRKQLFLIAGSVSLFLLSSLASVPGALAQSAENSVEKKSVANPSKDAETVSTKGPEADPETVLAGKSACRSKCGSRRLDGRS